MKIGNYDLGTPIEVGITGDNQFYYPVYHGAPLFSNDYNCDDINSTAFYLRGAHSSINQFPSYLRDTKMFDFKQQFVSPGTAYGYGKKLDTDNNPFVDASPLLSERISERIINETNSGATPSTYTNVLSSGIRRLKTLSNSSNQNIIHKNLYTGINTRYNPIYHSSLFTELIKHNVKNAFENDIPVNMSSGGVRGIENITKFLFSGKFSNTSTTTPFNVGEENFKFVESGLPYVKFRIQSNVIDENGNPVATSDNEVGYIDYYVLMRTTNHIVSDFPEAELPAGILQTYSIIPELYDVNNLLVQISQTEVVLNVIYDMLNFSKDIVPTALNLLSGVGSIVPTIIADFRNPTYSISVDDANLDLTSENTPSGFSQKLSFPLPGRHNPNNNESRMPNRGYFPGANNLTSGVDENTALSEYLNYQASFLLMGAHPFFFTFDNLYLQDYDVLGQFPENPSYETMKEFFYDSDWVSETILFLNTVAISLETNVTSTDARNENITKARVMCDRLQYWSILINGNFENGMDNIGDWSIFYSGQPYMFGAQEGVVHHLNWSPVSTLPLDDDFLAAWNYLESTIFNVPSTFGKIFEQMSPSLNQYVDIYKMEDAYSNAGLRMFGPPAPIGYVPRCGQNYRNYFGLDDEYEIGTPTVLGNTQFQFNGGLNVGGVDAINSTLGYDATQLLGDFNLENIYPGVTLASAVALKIFDRELWKLFYDVQLLCLRLRDSNQQPGGYHFTNSGPLRTLEFLDLGLQDIFVNNQFTQKEKDKFTFCWKFNIWTRAIDTQFNTEGVDPTYASIIEHFRDSELAPNLSSAPTGQPMNPYDDASYEFFSIHTPNYRTTIRDLLLQCPIENGGIANFELQLWVQWLQGGCVQNYITPHIAPNFNPSIDNFSDVNQYGVFEGSLSQLLQPASADNNYVDVVFNNPDVNITSWSELASYLNGSGANNFPELRTGAINYIGQIINLNLDSEDFSNAMIFSGINGVGLFYASNPEVPFPSNFFTYQEGNETPTIRVVFNNVNQTLSTTAFGPPVASLGFESGTTFLQMINELVSEGIEGQQIDCYPHNGVGDMGDGIYDLQDGYTYLETTNQTGQPDYRPLQLIDFTIKNNLMDTLTYLLPPASSPNVAGDTIDFEEEVNQPVKLPVPIIATGIFDNINSAVSTTYGSNLYLRNAVNVGFFSDGPGTNGMQKNVLEDNGYQKKGHINLKGNEITTGSRNASNHPYFFPLVVQFENTNEFNAEEFFDVSWGHIRGEGSLKKNNGTSPSEAIYRQAANELIGDASGSFYSISQSIKDQINSNNEPAYMSKNPTPDEYVWILKTKQNKIKENFNTLSSNVSPRFNLSGSDAAGNGVNKTLVCGARESSGPAPYVKQNGLKRYYISDGTFNLATSGVYGYWYPEIGTAVINSKITETITGGAGTTVTEFNKSGVAHNGMVPSGLTKIDKEYNNSLKLINCLKNKGNSNALQNFMYTSDINQSINILACIRLTANQFNFTTNHTRFVNMDPEQGYNTFNDTMKFDDNLNTSPTTYITHVDLYDNEGYRVATAKLSKPIKKDFNSEVIIKIMIKDT